jgi:hypothetical protein
MPTTQAGTTGTTGMTPIKAAPTSLAPTTPGDYQGTRGQTEAITTSAITYTPSTTTHLAPTGSEIAAEKFSGSGTMTGMGTGYGAVAPAGEAGMMGGGATGTTTTGGAMFEALRSEVNRGRSDADSDYYSGRGGETPRSAGSLSGPLGGGVLEEVGMGGGRVGGARAGARAVY